MAPVVPLISCDSVSPSESQPEPPSLLSPPPHAASVIAKTANVAVIVNFRLFVVNMFSFRVGQASLLNGSEHDARNEVLLNERVKADDWQHGQHHGHCLDVGCDLGQIVCPAAL